MELLPSMESRAWLLAELAELLERRGRQGFLTGTLFEPSRTHFPDRYSRDAASVKAISDRLLGHMGLGHLTSRVSVFTRVNGKAMVDGREVQVHEHAIAWFAGISGNVCEIGIDASRLADPHHLVADLTHELAHAYRTHHGLRHPDLAVEEELTDLTTVFLGFGILTLNDAYRHRASVVAFPGGVGLHRGEQRGGYLSPQALAYVLAAQLVARGQEGEDQRVLRLLGPTQQTCVRAALGVLGKELVREELGLDRPAAVAAGKIPRNQGAWVFRVRGHAAPRGALTGVALGVAGGAVGLAAGLWSLPGALAAALMAVILFSIVGRLRPRDRCSDPDCRAVLSARAERCPRCGGRIMATLSHTGDHLATEEAVADAVEAERKAAAVKRKGGSS